LSYFCLVYVVIEIGCFNLVPGLCEMFTPIGTYLFKGILGFDLIATKIISVHAHT